MKDSHLFRQVHFGVLNTGKLFGGCSLTEAILQTSKLIWETLPIAIIIALFSGALLVIQTAMSLKHLGGGIMGASVIGYGASARSFRCLLAVRLQRVQVLH